MSESAPAVQLIGMRKTFVRHFWSAPFVALDRLTLTIEQGEVFGLLGGNGAGKSTTFRLLAGLIHPTAGQGWIGGAPLGTAAALRHIGYVPDHPVLYDYLTAEEVLTLSAQLSGVDRARIPERVTALLDVVGLTEVRRLRLRNFSKGMVQRIGLAQALVHAPAVLLLDEPLSGLDLTARAEMRTILRTLNRKGTTILISAHVVDDVASLCHRAGLLVDGQLVAVGAPQEILRRIPSRAPGSVRSQSDEAALMEPAARRAGSVHERSLV